MSAQTVTISGKEFVLVPRKEYDRLRLGVGSPSDRPTPLSYAALAKEIVQRRRAEGMSQRLLAHYAGIPFETLNRIEREKMPPNISLLEKIFRALAEAERETEEDIRVAKRAMARIASGKEKPIPWEEVKRQLDAKREENSALRRQHRPKRASKPRRAS